MSIPRANLRWAHVDCRRRTHEVNVGGQHRAHVGPTYHCYLGWIQEHVYNYKNEPRHEKTGFLPMRNQRRLSKSFRYTDSTIILLLSLLVPSLEQDQLSNNNLIYTIWSTYNILGRFSFVSQWAIKLAQCQVSASFWISLAANGN